MDTLTTEITLTSISTRYGVPYQTLVRAAQTGRLKARKVGQRAWLVRPIDLVSAVVRGTLRTRPLPATRIYRTYTDDYAVTDSDDDGPCRIAWLDEDGTPTYDEIDGWIVDKHLFWPGDYISAPGDYITEDGLPDPDAAWSDVETGQAAVIGLPNAPLAVL